MNTYLILLPIVAPVLAGILLAATPIGKQEKARNGYTAACLVMEMLLLLYFAGRTAMECQVFTLTDQIPVYFHIDMVGAFFSVLMGVIWLISGIYAFEYMKHEGKEGRYFAFYLVAEGVLTGVTYAGNLVTLYMCFECMTLLTMPLVLHSGTRESVSAARKYMFYSIFGASAALGGIIILYIHAPSITFVPGGVFDAAAFGAKEGLYLVTAAVMITGFCGKAGLFPLHGWLPTAHPQAPSPASAVMSGIITKMGVLATIRVVFFIFGADFLRGTWVQTYWLVLILITIFMGSMMAFKEPLMKRRFAYSTVSQVSYVLLGLASMNAEGITGGFLHIVFHACAKTTLFLMAGAVIYYTGTTKVKDLKGLGRKMPIIWFGYTLASLSLVGVPPFGGFVSKEFLAHGIMGTEIGWAAVAGPVVLLISAVLTAGYLLWITIDGYEGNEKAIPLNWKMVTPIMLLGLGSILIGLFPGPLEHIAEQIAHALV